MIKDNNGNSSRISKYEQEQQIIWKLYHQLVDKPRHHPVNASSISISTPLKDPQPSISSKSSEITNKNNEKQKKSSISEENRFHNQDITSASTITSLLMKQKVNLSSSPSLPHTLTYLLS